MPDHRVRWRAAMGSAVLVEDATYDSRKQLVGEMDAFQIQFYGVDLDHRM
jgi:hypothetical protein